MKPTRILDSLANIPLARPLTSFVLSRWASSALKRRVRVFHDSVWLRKDGEVTIALGPRLRIRRSEILHWKPNAGELTELAASWWYLFYKPNAGDVIVDIGAGMGEDAILFSRSVGERGLIYSFEAHPVTAHCLKKTIEHSRLKDVTPVHGAILDWGCATE